MSFTLHGLAVSGGIEIFGDHRQGDADDVVVEGRDETGKRQTHHDPTFVAPTLGSSAHRGLPGTGNVAVSLNSSLSPRSATIRASRPVGRPERP